jgi:hypothetical protein
MPGLMADQQRLLEGHADLVSTYPNDPAAPDHTISLDHQLKPIWNIGRIGNFDCSPVDRDVPYPTACARSPDRNKCRFVDLGTRMPASLVHILLVHPWSQSKVKLLLVGTTNEPPDGGHRAGTLAGMVRDTVPSGTPRPDLTAGFCAAKMGNWLVRQKAYAYDFQNALRKTMTGTARRQAK